jgi:Domain of unknown function (DUF3850)
MPSEPYQAVLDGSKRAVTRLQGGVSFAVDDILVLQELTDGNDAFTGREAFVQVTYVECTIGMSPDELLIASIERRAWTTKTRTSTQSIAAVPATIVGESAICAACSHSEPLHEDGPCFICGCQGFRASR